MGGDRSESGIDPGEVTVLLERLKEDPAALDQVMNLVYQDIHRVARFERSSLNVQSAPETTVLVHEAFLKMFRGEGPEIENRKHLKRMSAMVVRQLIVDEARAQLAQKRGAGAHHTSFDRVKSIAQTGELESLLSLENAIVRLEEMDPELAEIVVSTYFGGLTAPELADALGVSLRTVQRQLKRARAWLKLELSNGHPAT